MTSTCLTWTAPWMNSTDWIRANVTWLNCGSFSDFSADETAQLLSVSKATVDRELRFVRGWMFERLRPHRPVGTCCGLDQGDLDKVSIAAQHCIIQSAKSLARPVPAPPIADRMGLCEPGEGPRPSPHERSRAADE